MAMREWRTEPGRRGELRLSDGTRVVLNVDKGRDQQGPSTLTASTATALDACLRGMVLSVGETSKFSGTRAPGRGHGTALGRP